ncbi:MAG: SGNH/GDSL hydrolase family protein [Acidimicrobiia bacterium]|nr:SGNH/GDSL hydrolase family protein [Acidimicrobiia bacterium]
MTSANPSGRRRALVLLMFVALLAVSALIGVGVFDAWARWTDPAAADLWWKYPARPILISKFPFVMADSDTLVRGLYPHVEQDGEAPWESRGRRPDGTEYRITSSRYGFFTKHPIDRYPPKGSGEVRIIVVGGSGAQGHGATSFDRTFYSVMERQLQAAVAPAGGTVEIINLAMAGAFAARNAVVIDRYGPALDPDLILLYNGANDIAQFTQEAKWIEYCDEYRTAFIDATYEYPDALRPWAERLPYLFNVYGWGRWLKATFYREYYDDRALRQCWKDNGYQPAADGSFDSHTTFDQVSYPSFVRAVQSIKRGTCGLPIVWALQAVHTGENALYEGWIRPGIYDEFFHRASQELDGYYNDRWRFIDVNRLARDPARTDVADYVDTSLAVHLDDAGHQVVGTVLADELAPLVRDLASRRRMAFAARCAGVSPD